MRKLAITVVVLALIGFAAFWVLTAPASIPASALGAHTTDLANGREMFYAGGCTACHTTPDSEDRTRLGGGRALPTQFGTFYVPNISPDPDDGIGRWSEANFVTALIDGTSPDGRHYYPAFPYTSYQRIKLDDARDMFAFLKTLPPVKGKVRDHDLPLPFNIRRVVGGWKLLFLDGKPFVPDSAQSPEWNRGAYLVNGPGHCAECHSPRNILGAIIQSQRFAGGPNPEGEGWIPNITQKDLKDYSRDDIEEILTTGHTPGGDSVGGGMVAVVRNTTELTPEDRAAMALYIKSLPPVDGPKPPK